MANGDGKNNNSFRIIMYLIGVLVTIVVLIGAPSLWGNMIKNDRIRESEDTRIEAKVDLNGKDVSALKANFTFQNKLLTEINKEQKAILREVRK